MSLLVSALPLGYSALLPALPLGYTALLPAVLSSFLVKRACYLGWDFRRCPRLGTSLPLQMNHPRTRPALTLALELSSF